MVSLTVFFEKMLPRIIKLETMETIRTCFVLGIVIPLLWTGNEWNWNLEVTGNDGCKNTIQKF